MQFDREKLKAVILYACGKCEPMQMGAVKLHKVLYFADMLRFIQTGNSITGSTYRKRPLGPTCDQLLPALRSLEQAGQLQIQSVEYFGYMKKEYIPQSDMDYLISADEMALLDEVVRFVCHDHTAQTISEFSHNKAWELAEFGDELPYTSAFRLIPLQVSQETTEWANEQGALVEQLKSDKKNDLGLKPFRVIRERLLERAGDK